MMPMGGGSLAALTLDPGPSLCHCSWGPGCWSLPQLLQREKSFGCRKAGLTSSPWAVLSISLWRGLPVTLAVTTGKAYYTCVLHGPSVHQVAPHRRGRDTGTSSQGSSN